MISAFKDRHAAAVAGVHDESCFRSDRGNGELLGMMSELRHPAQTLRLLLKRQKL